MKRILVFIDSSLGELDWISPFLTSNYAKDFDITVVLNRSNLTKQHVINNYFSKTENIKVLNANDVFIENKLKNIFFRFSKSLRKRLNKFSKICEYISRFNSLLLKLESKIDLNRKYDFIFHDTGLHESLELMSIISYNFQAKIVAFPHSIGIRKTIKPLLNKLSYLDIDLWLESTNLSKKVLDNGTVYVSGAPALDRNLANNKICFDFDSSNILLLTRDKYECCGCTRESFLEKFEKVLIFCEQNNFNVFVKHHPRDKKIDQYRNIQSKFSNVKEYNKSLANLDLGCRACLTSYSTAGMYLTVKQIPVFDITPYENCNNAILSKHYCGNDGTYTHDMIELGIQDKILNLNILLNKEELSNYSSRQFKSLEKYFPLNANERIFKKLLELQNIHDVSKM